MTLRSILVACDFSEASNRAVALAAELAEKCGAELQLVHVHVDLENGSGDPIAGTLWATVAQRDRYMIFLVEELRRTCALVAPMAATHAHYRVVRGDPVKRLRGLASELGSDLLCLGATGKSAVERVLLGSVTQSLIRTSAVPVLTVP